VDWYRWQHDTLMLDIRLQPRAGKDEIIGEYAGRLKIRLAAPPVDGQANKSLLNFWQKFARCHYDRSASSAARPAATNSLESKPPVACRKASHPLKPDRNRDFPDKLPAVTGHSLTCS